jgi:O-antigen/teichoic acid export membrane protein
MCISLIYGTLLTASGQLKVLNWISVIGILINLSVNVVLIPKYGAAGAAIAVLFTQSITALAQLIYCHIKYSIAINWKEIRNYCLFIAVLLITPILLKDSVFQFYMQISSGIIGLFVFKLIDVKEILRFLKEK